MDDAVMQALKRHLASAETIDVSRYQFVNMEAVRSAAGDLWPEVRERVFLASHSIIERRVADEDLIIQCASGFLVIYKAVSGSTAEQTTSRIRADLERFFLGERFANLMRVQATSEKLTPAEFEAALAEAQIDASAPQPPKRPETRARHPGVISKLEFLSAWDVRNEAVASFLVSPVVLEHENGPAMTSATLAASLVRPEDRLAFDKEVLRRACDSLEPLLKAGTRCALVVPAGYSALAAPRHRAGYVSALAALPPELKPLIRVRVTGAPSDAPPAVIAETGRTLLPYTSQLFLDAELKAASLERQLESEAHWIGADLPARLTDAVRQDVERFLSMAGRAGRSVYFNAVDDWESFRFASRTQARFLSGEAIGRLDEPSAPFRLARTRLLSRAA